VCVCVCVCVYTNRGIDEALEAVEPDAVTFFIRREGEDNSVLDRVPKLNGPETVWAPEFRLPL
jgi:hypothetical protein